MLTRRHLIALSAASVLAPDLFVRAARAQKADFPNKPVRLIVPVAAGGPTDIVARMLAEKLSKMWGQQVVIENKGGAGTNIGNEYVAQSDPDGSRHVIVRREADLDLVGDGRPRFVQCVEGGFHLGPDVDAVAGQIANLAERGVFYITLAHLFFRGVAANAPALPMFSDEQYNAIFDQPDEGLPELGRAAVGAMCDLSVVVDLSHMRRDAIDETLDELDRIDPNRTMPVIASHVGAASEGPKGHAYNLTPETMRRVRDRDGVIGIIMAQHLLGQTGTPDDSRELLRRHVLAVRDAVGGHDNTVIGTDLDGFISPTLAGIQKAEDLATLEQWIRQIAPNDAEAILHTNAERIVRATLRRRATARGE